MRKSADRYNPVVMRIIHILLAISSRNSNSNHVVLLIEDRSTTVSCHYARRDIEPFDA